MTWCPAQNTEISKDPRKGHQKKKNRHLITLRSILKNTILPVMVAHDNPGMQWQRQEHIKLEISVGYTAKILSPKKK